MRLAAADKDSGSLESDAQIYLRIVDCGRRKAQPLRRISDGARLDCTATAQASQRLIRVDFRTSHGRCVQSKCAQPATELTAKTHAKRRKNLAELNPLHVVHPFVGRKTVCQVGLTTLGGGFSAKTATEKK